MKKFFSLVLTAALTLSLAACGSKPAAPAASTPAAPAPAASTPAASDPAASGYSGGEYKITLGHICSETHSLQVTGLQFKEYLEEKSGGKITVELFPNAVLGGDEAMLESVAMGTLTMVMPSASVMNVYDPAFGILAMPYLFTSTDKAFAAVDGGLGDRLNQRLLDANVGLVNLGYNFNGIRNMTNNKRAIESLADMSGLKMRCMSNEMFITMFSLMGANATPMSWSELFTALQQGTVDGEENPASLIYESKFQEVQKYISTTEHIYDFDTIVINRNFYEGLDAEAKALIDEATALYLVDAQREMEVSQNEEFLQKLADEGMTVTYLSDEARAEFAAAVAPMYDNAVADFGQDIMDAVAAYR